MPPFRTPPDSYASAPRIVRGTRWVLDVMQRPRLAESLSWLIWLLGVVMFAVWTHVHYRVPSGPPWIGMTIHTAVFAIWTQVLREWVMLYVHRRLGHHTRRNTGDRRNSDD